MIQFFIKNKLFQIQVAGQDGSIKLVNKNGTPQSAKSALTSLLMSNSGTPTGNKTIIGTRRVLITKGADGTSRTITQTTMGQKTSTSSTPGTPGQQSLIKNTNQPPKDGPQKVQIIRGPDGKVTVRGLMAGQQLLQMPDGKLHVIVSGQSANIPSGGQIIATGGAPPTPKISVTSAVKPHAKVLPSITTSKTLTTSTATTPTNVIIRQQTPLKAVTTTNNGGQIVQGNAKIVTQGTPQIVVQGNQPVLIQSPQVVQNQVKIAQSPMVQVSQGKILQTTNRPMQTVLVQGNSQVVQGQIMQGGQMVQSQVTRPVNNQIITSTPNKLMSPQHLYCKDPGIGQQLAAGKLQLATINGQQVLIRPIGNNQAVIVAHVTPQNAPPDAAIPNNQPVNNTQTIIQAQNVVQQVAPITQAPAQSTVTQQMNPVSPVKLVSPVQAPTPPVTPQAAAPLTDEQIMEQRLLVGQPPGTVIKTVTAQVKYTLSHTFIVRN